MKKQILFLTFLLFSTHTLAENGHFYANESYTISRKRLFDEIYSDYKKTLYCQIPFDENGKLSFPEGFDMSKIADRVQRIEIEHVISAERFGSYIKQWWNGDALCVDKDKKPYKGRRCAEKTSRLFRLMQSDMYNLFPSVGSINALRGNLDFNEFPAYIPSLYQNCTIKIADGKIEIPDTAKGVVARVYLYFKQQYPFFELSQQEITLFQKWHKTFPVTKWECDRTYKIEQIQHNENKVIKQQCIEKQLWPIERKE